MQAFPTDTHGLIHRTTLINIGFTDDDIRRAVKAKRIGRIARGVFVYAGERTAEEWHRLKAIASKLGQASKIPLTHQSAATVLGLAMLKPNLRRVHTTAGRGHGFRTDRQHCHVAELADDQIILVSGVWVTSIERTAVDVACTVGTFAEALTIFDSALRAGADREVMRAMLSGRRRGIGRARRALYYADGASESPGESWSRAQMIEAGLPMPRLQREFVDEDGNVVARTDFDWHELLVGEFDGKVKYAKLLRPGKGVTEVVVREKAREDTLRSMGIMVVRWIWADLEKGTVVDLVRKWLVHVKLLAA